MPTEPRYYVWSPHLGEKYDVPVYHDGFVVGGLVAAIWTECIIGPQMDRHGWRDGPKPPPGHRLCKRCRKLRRAKG